MPLPEHAQPAVGRLLLQWHLTDRCNLSCAHCYQDDADGTEMPFGELPGVLAQFELLLAEMGRLGGRPARGHITLTGGEPFLRPDLWGLLELLAGSSPRRSFAILTNGTLIDGGLARRLAELRPAFVQVSVEGGEETHDRIRGRGSHAAATAGLRHLVAAGIHAVIAFTAHRGNWREFPDVAGLGRRLGVRRVWADRLVPCGRGADLSGATLGPEEAEGFFRLMLRERRCRPAGRTEIAMGRALQFLVAGGLPYRCVAGESLLALLPDGAVLPCRRLPLPVGDVRHASLRDLYFESPILRELRDRRRVPAGCERCFHSLECRGGARCLALAAGGDAFRADPGCWLARRQDAADDPQGGFDSEVAALIRSGAGA
ncbi:MAG TPA: radical SAM protein [Planctomycetota bacterium]|nr:radical SAM protein [Planctomycetota bacterium]